jgi:CubicO group peptidase (beta-lactamase class C family)
MRFDLARQILRGAIDERAFPAAVVEVGTATDVLWREPFGRLSYDADAEPTRDDTIFDLASLTKVIATAPIVMQQVERGAIGLDDLVSIFISDWRGVDRESVTIRDLLAHASGLTGYVPLYRDHSGRTEFQRTIATLPLEYPPRTTSIYSDLAFILLAFIIEDVGEAPLAARFDTLLSQMGIVDRLQFNPPRQWRRETAPTEVDAWRGRVLVGEVHDENTWALGGVSGHAGLFGTCAAVGAYARHLLQVLAGRTGVIARATLATFVARRDDVPGSSRALAWDTMLPTSSCGTRMSQTAFGHTGFTGTSLWIDPERGMYVVLLTNRVHPSRSNERIKQVRPAVHDAVVDAFDATRGA